MLVLTYHEVADTRKKSSRNNLHGYNIKDRLSDEEGGNSVVTAGNFVSAVSKKIARISNKNVFHYFQNIYSKFKTKKYFIITIFLFYLVLTTLYPPKEVSFAYEKLNTCNVSENLYANKEEDQTSSEINNLNQFFNLFE